MKLQLILKLFIFALLFSPFTLGQVAKAQSSEITVKNLDKRIAKLQRKAARRFARLTQEQKISVLLARAEKSDDSDDDGVPDNFEDSSGRCDSDSDDDGKEDGSEYEDGTDPEDGDSDDDGHGDNVEFNVKAEINTIDSSSLSAAEEIYVLNGDTEYLDDDNNPVDNSFFEAGDCVEIEGHVDGSDNIVEKIKPDDDC